MANRTRDCDEVFTAGRLRKAEQFLEAAETVRDVSDDEGDVGDALVTLCVHAGIAASDVLCCKALGHYVQGDDHQQAIGELSRVMPDGKQLSRDLRALLAIKTLAGYAAPTVSTEDRKRAFRRAEGLVEAARSR